MKNKKRVYKTILATMAVLLISTIVILKLRGGKVEVVNENNPVKYYGEMQVSGNRIIGAKTEKPMQVKGMSFFWSNSGSKFYNGKIVDKMVDEFNVEVVRVAYGVDEHGNPYTDSYMRDIKKVVEAAISRGIYVVIDWHSHGAEKNVDNAKDFFKTVAEEYGKYDNVIFEIYNEPIKTKWVDIKKYAEQVIPVIRKYSDNLIVVGNPTWSQDVNKAADDPINDNNVAYSLHFYAGTHGQSLRNKADYALSKNVALFVTEWGSVTANGNGGIYKEATEEWLKWMEDNEISWANWAINDKAETSSIFNTNGTLTETGEYLKALIKKGTENSQWKKAQ